MRSVVAALAVLFAVAAGAQQVTVFNVYPPNDGSTPSNFVTPNDLNQPLFVIPVVTQDTAWDPNNNDLPAATRTATVQKFQQASQFWTENSYGRISFAVDIAPHVYQMPRGRSFYFNPSYVAPEVVGTQLQGPVTVPAGTLHLLLHISAADETPIDIVFSAAESPFTLDMLRNKVSGALGVGDKLACDLVNDGPSRGHLHLAVGQSYVTEGTFIHVNRTTTPEPLLAALGLDQPVEDITAPGISVQSRGAQFPLTTTAGSSTINFTLTNQAGATEVFTWTLPAQMFASAAALAAAAGAGTPNGTVTAVGSEVRFDVTPTLAGPYATLEAGGPPDLLHALGVAKAHEADGVVDAPSSDTIRGDWPGIAGQAVAALLINELSRPFAGPGTDPFPNMAISAANEAAINALIASNIQNHRSIMVMFLDAPPLARAGASGGFLHVGIDNGGYSYRYQLLSNMHIIFDSTAPETIGHELGHSVGFFDLYNNSNDYLPSYRYSNDWDVMSSQWFFPHTDYWHKEVIANWLTAAGTAPDVFPDPAMGAETRHYLLTPIEIDPASYDNAIAVPAGRTRVKGLRLPLGLPPASDHHYLTVTNRQAGTQFSQTLPQKTGAAARGGVYVTDAISPSVWMDNLFAPTSRNVVHPLTDRALVTGDNVSPVLDSAPDADVDFLQTFPAYAGVTVDIVGSVPGPGGFAGRPSYLVDVTREQRDYLDLMITPWGAPPYESPDIWIEHTDHALSATPLPGNGEPARWSTTYDPAANGGVPLNWIRVNVTNAGTVDATNVRVRVKVNQPGGMGDTGTWVALPTSDPQDIPHGQSRIFSLGWTPRVNRHTCVEAEVISYDSPLGDRDPWNQRTQENVNDFYPTSSSPWGPTPMEFEIANKRATPIKVIVEPQELPPGYLVKLDQSFLTIPAKSKVLVTGTLFLDSNVIPPPSGNTDHRFKPGQFHMAAFIQEGDYRLPMGGITFRVFPNKRITPNVTVTVDNGGNIVVDGSTSPAAPGDHVEILVCYASGRCEWIVTTTDGGGKIHTSIPPKESGHVTVTVYPPPKWGTSGPTDTVVDTNVPGSGTGSPLTPGGGLHEFGFFVGGFFPSHATALESGLDTGFRFAKYVTPHLSAEGEGGIVFTRRFRERGLLGHAQAHLLWHAGTATQPVRPFVLAGVGLASFHTPTYSDSTPAFVLGLGADFRWRPDVAFRFDVRDFVMTGLLGSGTTHNFQGLWGVTFRF